MNKPELNREPVHPDYLSSHFERNSNEQNVIRELQTIIWQIRALVGLWEKSGDEGVKQKINELVEKQNRLQRQAVEMGIEIQDTIEGAEEIERIRLLADKYNRDNIEKES